MKIIKNQKLLHTLRLVKNVLLGAIIVFLTLTLIVTMIARFTGKAPSLFGFSLYRVSSGSMEPELEVGDIILVQKCDGAAVQKDDIVSYIATSGIVSGNLVTHRVVRAPYEENGKTYVVTRGDANSIDDDPILAEQIQGKYLMKITLLNYLFDFFVTPWGLLTLIALIILAFFNEILILVKTVLGIGDKPQKKPKHAAQEIISRYQMENKASDETAEPTDACEPVEKETNEET